MNETDLIAPIEKGQKLSTLQVWNGTVCISQSDVFAMNRVPVMGTEFDEDVEKTAAESSKIVKVVLVVLLCAVAVVVICIVVFRLVRRRYRKVMIQKQHRQYRHSRRRSR